jgi:hypothetical protein
VDGHRHESAARHDREAEELSIVQIAERPPTTIKAYVYEATGEKAGGQVPLPW